MAKGTGAVAKREETALSTIGSTALAEALEGIDFGDGGLGEVDMTDVKIGRLRWNYNKPVNGEEVKRSDLVNTLTNEVTPKKRLVFLHLHKTRRFATYDDATGKSEVHCKSDDAKIGTPSSGGSRKCEGCPHAAWKTIEGKRVKDCDEVANVLAMDRDADPESPVIVAFQRTGMDAWKTHLNRFHIGKLRKPGGAANVPLAAVAVVLSAKKVDGKAHAVPVIELDGTGEVSREDMVRYAESARFWKEKMLPALAAQEDPAEDAREGGNVVDSSFEFGANAGAGFADPSLKG